MSKIDDSVRFASETFLLSYVKAMFRDYEIANHHRKIAEALQKVESGEITRLIIEAPPRHGKTFLVSEFFPSWFIGKNPDLEVMYITYAQSLASKVGRRVRNLLSSIRFNEIFPNSILSQDSKSKNEFAMMQGGEYHALGIDGQATGKGAHLAILDDTIKNKKQAMSKTYREAVKEFYKTAVYTRLYPGGRIVVMQTRWHSDDLIGYLLKEHKDENWTVIKLPAIDTVKNKALWPSRYPLEKLQVIRNALGEFDFQALYQQSPIADTGEIFNKNWFKFYRKLPENLERIIMSWDMSFKKSEDSSFVVCQIWGMKSGNAYLIEQFRAQIGFVDTLKNFASLSIRYPQARIKLVENKANGPAIIDALEDRFGKITPVEVNSSKEARANSVSDIIQQGNVWVPDPETNPWVAEYLNEMIEFPKGDHDDQVDATTQALEFLFGSKSNRLKDLLIY